MIETNNWVTSKIAKTFFTIVFVCTSYLITRQFIVGAFDMILLLFIIDFIALTLSTDIVTGSQKPGSWKIKPLVELGFVLGLLNSAEVFASFFLGRRYFQVTSIDQIHSFGFAIMFLSGIVAYFGACGFPINHWIKVQANRRMANTF